MSNLEDAVLVNFGGLLDRDERAAIRNRLAPQQIVIIDVLTEIDYSAPSGVNGQFGRVIARVKEANNYQQPSYMILPASDGLLAMALRRAFPDTAIIVMVDSEVDAVVAR